MAIAKSAVFDSTKPAIFRSDSEMIVNKMRAEGYHNLSAWLRKKLLSSSLWMENKIDEIYRCVLDQNRMKEENNDLGEDKVIFAS